MIDYHCYHRTVTLTVDITCEGNCTVVTMIDYHCYHRTVTFTGDINCQGNCTFYVYPKHQVLDRRKMGDRFNMTIYVNNNYSDGDMMITARNYDFTCLYMAFYH